MAFGGWGTNRGLTYTFGRYWSQNRGYYRKSWTNWNYPVLTLTSWPRYSGNFKYLGDPNPMPNFYKNVQTSFNYAFSDQIVLEFYGRKPYNSIPGKWAGWDWNQIRLSVDNTTLTNIEDPLVAATASILIQDSKIQTIASMFKYVYGLELRSPNVAWNERTAADTIERQYGGAADKAILLAAMLRYANIPARVIEGFLDGEHHAWIEFNYKGSWTWLDPTNEKFMYDMEDDTDVAGKGLAAQWLALGVVFHNFWDYFFGDYTFYSSADLNSDDVFVWNWWEY